MVGFAFAFSLCLLCVVRRTICSLVCFGWWIENCVFVCILIIMYSTRLHIGKQLLLHMMADCAEAEEFEKVRRCKESSQDVEKKRSRHIRRDGKAVCINNSNQIIQSFGTFNFVCFSQSPPLSLYHRYYWTANCKFSTITYSSYIFNHSMWIVSEPWKRRKKVWRQYRKGNSEKEMNCSRSTSEYDSISKDSFVFGAFCLLFANSHQ